VQLQAMSALLSGSDLGAKQSTALHSVCVAVLRKRYKLKHRGQSRDGV
jgi:hypothetical protein